MKRGLLLFFSAVFCIPAFTQRKNFTYNFYGFVRADLFYDTRNNETTVSDNFYLFPKNTVYDADGKVLAEVTLPDAQQIYDQQFRREAERSAPLSANYEFASPCAFWTAFTIRAMAALRTAFTPSSTRKFTPINATKK